jgi:hypothetical protein
MIHHRQNPLESNHLSLKKNPCSETQRILPDSFKTTIQREKEMRLDYAFLKLQSLNQAGLDDELNDLRHMGEGRGVRQRRTKPEDR